MNVEAIPLTASNDVALGHLYEGVHRFKFDASIVRLVPYTDADFEILAQDHFDIESLTLPEHRSSRVLTRFLIADLGATPQVAPEGVFILHHVSEDPERDDAFFGETGRLPTVPTWMVWPMIDPEFVANVPDEFRVGLQVSEPIRKLHWYSVISDDDPERFTTWLHDGTDAQQIGGGLPCELEFLMPEFPPRMNSRF